MDKLQAGQMIEWNDLDKRKFYVIGPSCFIMVRMLLYPFNLIKTRLFMQQKTSHYSGTFDAFGKVVRHEGFRGLYKGFMVSSLGMLSGQLYITTYEVIRSNLKSFNSEVKGLIAGGCATLVGQSVTVPIDVVSQIMMMQGQVVARPTAKSLREPYIVVKNVDYIIPRSDTIKLRGAMSIVKDIVQREGMRGLYRGYLVSLLTYAPNSALWWGAYTGFYRKTMETQLLATREMPLPLVQAVCGMAAGLLASVLTNPLDVFRTRYQLESSRTIGRTMSKLWYEEGIGFLGKGLSARIISTVPTSALLVMSYEWVKRLSLKTS